MTCCIACGFDAAAVVTARFELFVPMDSKSDNGRTVNAGSSRWAYKANRDAWSWRIRAVMAGVCKAKGRRRLTVTRFYSGRQQARDQDNYVTSLKPAIDALVRHGLLVDDSATGVDGPYYRQLRVVGKSLTGIEFVLEEMADG